MSRPLILITFLGLFCLDLFAKDYKGLFGSYRKDQYTENEGLQTAFGVDLMIGSFFPLSALSTSDEGIDGSTGERVTGPLAYSTTFNIELQPYLTLMYRWQIFARIGYADYETRKQNTLKKDTSGSGLPLFHEFEMQVMPLLGGVKYRFSQSDLVPYVSLGAGIVYVQRKASYDYSPLQQRQFLTAFAADAGIGMEFYFSARAGIRVDVSGFYMKLPTNTFDPTGTGVVGSDPNITMEGNSFSVRYASGIFIIF